MVTTSASHPSRRIGRARPRAAALVIVLSSLGVSIGPAQQSYGDGSKRSEDIAAAGRVSPASERSSPMHGASEPAASTASTASRASIAAATDTAALPTWAAVSVIGAPGTFGSLAADRTNGLDVVPVEGWGFLPGQAAYFTAVDRAGRVIIANEPQTDIQPRPTGDGMVFSTFDPDTRTFVNHRVPTSVGSTTTSVARLAGVGGADIADLEVINTRSGEQLVFTSMSPYGGWDPSTDGVYPSLSILNETRSGWSPEIGQHYTAADLETAGGAGETVCGRRLPTGREKFADCGGIAEIDALPRSGYLAATQYFGHPEAGQRNGMVVVLDPAGRVAAALPYPRTIDVDGHEITVRPREVDADPTSVDDDERFVVIFDVDPDAARQTQPLFAAQEFHYVASRSVIEAVSIPFTTGGTVGGRRAGTETALYDSRGDLWIVDTVPGSLAGGRTSLYRPGAGRARLARGACAANGDSISAGWGTACAPDGASDVTIDVGGPVRSLTDDPARGRVVAVTMGGAAISITDDLQTRTLLLPVNALGDRSRLSIGPRKAALDAARDALWVPIQQLQTASTCAAWPCSPERLDQWLVRIDLTRL